MTSHLKITTFGKIKSFVICDKNKNEGNLFFYRINGVYGLNTNVPMNTNDYL